MNSITCLNSYRRSRDRGGGIKNITPLFPTITIVDNACVKVYLCNNKFTLIKLNNNRIYRIGPSLEEILVHNIPSNWRCIGTYHGLSYGNIQYLYNLLFNNKQSQ